MTDCFIKDQVLAFVLKKAEAFSFVRTIKLFGSRARGDARERSDYDLAVYTSPITHSEWAKFTLDIQENAPTLCGIDLVQMNDSSIDPGLQSKIEQEGIVVYEYRIKSH